MALSELDKYKVTPALVINMFMQEKMRSILGEIWHAADMPFFVPQEQPEDVDNAGGYVVYVWMGRPTGDLYVLETGTLSYIIHHRTVANVTATINLMREWLDRWDDSAADINDWLWADKPAAQQDMFDELRKSDFKHVRVVAHIASDPMTDEGGRPDASVTLELSYTHDGFN